MLFFPFSELKLAADNGKEIPIDKREYSFHLVKLLKRKLLKLRCN